MNEYVTEAPRHRGTEAMHDFQQDLLYSRVLRNNKPHSYVTPRVCKRSIYEVTDRRIKKE